MALRQISARLEEDLIKEVKHICLERDITLQEVLKQLLTKFVEENKKE